jgi:DNA-binding XRE family transcriptional regulator
MTQHHVSRADDYNRFAFWLNEKIGTLGWSNNKAAQLMNVGPTTLANWREGRYLPSPNAARAISWALSVSMLEVLCYLSEITDEDLLAEIARRGI